MTPPTPAYLDAITGVAEQWLRRCNGKPTAGAPVSADRLRVVLANSRNIRTEDGDTIVWSGPAGEFTAKPVRGDAAQ